MARHFAFAAIAALGLTSASARADSGAGILGLLEPGSFSAPALGGDPFLSPLDDEAGWWSRLSARPARTLAITMDEAEPVSRRASGDRGRLGSSGVTWEGSYAGNWSAYRWIVDGRLVHRGWDGSWSGPQWHAALRGAGTRQDVAFRVEDPRHGLAVQGSGPVGGGSGSLCSPPLGVGVRFGPGAGLAAQCRWEQQRHPELFESSFYDQELSASLNLRSDALSADGRMPLSYGLQWEGSAQQCWYREVSDAGAPKGYALTPRGRSSSNQMSLARRVGRQGTILVRRSAMDADVEGNTSYKGERFGRLTYARCRLESYLVAFQPISSRRGRAFIEGEFVRLDGEARASVETWPFTTTLLDLLGYRRIFKVSGWANWTRLHAASEVMLGSRLRASAGVSWYDIRPRLVVESWRPAFLVFGRADYERENLEVRRARLAVLGLGLSRAMGSWELHATLQQVVFAQADKEDASGGGESEPAGTHVEGVPGGGPGGTRVIVSAMQRF